MSDQSTSEANINNDVQVIRNILLGEHIDNFQRRIEALEKEINSLQKENKVLRKLVETEKEKYSQALTARSGQLESTLMQIKDQQTEMIESLRKDFDSTTKEFGKRLSVHENQQGGLIASLADALLSYQKHLEK